MQTNRNAQKGTFTIVLENEGDEADLRQIMLEGSSAHSQLDFASMNAANRLYLAMTALPAGTLKLTTIAGKAFPSKADRKAGRGFPCTAGCTRTDLRTAKNAAMHATTQAELAVGGHAPDRKPLPKV